MEKLNRTEEAILFILYKHHPIPLHKEQIFEEILKDGVLNMSEEDFIEYKKNIKKTKEN